MILLDDDIRPEPGRRRKWFWRLVKVGCVFGVLFFLGIVLLTRIGGNDDNLRQGLESAIGRAAGGRPVKVGMLHGVSFFPFIRVYAENIKVFPSPPVAATTDEGATPAADMPSFVPEATLKTLMFSRSFWDSFFWRNGIEGIRLEGMALLPGFVTPGLLEGDIVMEPAAFDGKPGIAFKGAYDDYPATLAIGLTLDHKNMRPVFSVKGSMPFTFFYRDTKIFGRMAVYNRRLYFIAADAAIDGGFFGLWDDATKDARAAQCVGGALSLDGPQVIFAGLHATFEDFTMSGQGRMDTAADSVAFYFNGGKPDGAAQPASLTGDWNQPVKGHDTAPQADDLRFPPLSVLGVDENHPCAAYIKARK